MRCVVVGTGFGGVHASWLASISGVEIDTLVYNSDKDRAQSLRGAHGIRAISTDMRSALQGTGCDFVSIVSPPDTHADYLKIALDAGVPAVIDKPLAQSVEDAEKMSALASSATDVFVFFQWRLHPAARQVRDLVVSEGLGRLTHVEAGFEHDFLASNATLWPWRHQKETAGGGSLGDMGVHLFDLVRYVTGREWVVKSAQTGLAHPRRQTAGAVIDCTADDFADVHIGCPDDEMTGRVTTSRVALGQRRIWLRLYGEGGVVSVVFDPDTGKAEMSLAKGTDVVSQSGFENINPYQPILSALRGSADNFSPPALIKDGLAAQHLMAAALTAVTATHHANH